MYVIRSSDVKRPLQNVQKKRNEYSRKGSDPIFSAGKNGIRSSNGTEEWNFAEVSCKVELRRGGGDATTSHGLKAHNRTYSK